MRASKSRLVRLHTCAIITDMQQCADNRDDSAVDVRNVTFLRNDRAILDSVSWHVAAGEQAAILGPNGSGKSTLVRILLGYIWPTQGTVRVAGRKFGETNLNDLRKIVRLVQSNSPFEIDPVLTLRQVVFTGYEGTLGVYSTMDSTQHDAINAMIRRVGLSQVADNSYGYLSTGERLRTQLARAMIVQPSVLILDEPTAGLDIRGREELLDLLEHLRDSPKSPALIMVTHHTEELPRGTTNVLLLDNGSVKATGTAAEVLTSDQLSSVYGCAVEVHPADGRYYLHARVSRW